MPHTLDRLQRAALLLTAVFYAGGYATVGLILMLLTVILETAALRKAPWTPTRLDLLLSAFILLFLISGIFSPFRAMAVSSVGLAALTIYLAFGVTSRVLQRDPRILVQLCWAWAAGGALTAIMAIAIHLRTGDPASTATLGQNAVGTTMVLTVVVALGLALHTRTAARALAAAISLLATAALLFTYTRGAWLGLGAGLILLIAFGGRRAARAGLLAAVAVVAVGAGTGGERSALAVRARSIIVPALHQSRIDLLRTGLVIFAHHPFIGTGMNTFPDAYPRYRVPGDVNPLDARPNAHNIIVNMAAEGGVLGLALFVALLAETFRLSWRWQARAPDGTARGLRMALLAALAGILVHQLFDGTLLSVHLGAGMWMLMAILVSSPDA